MGRRDAIHRRHSPGPKAGRGPLHPGRPPAPPPARRWGRRFSRRGRGSGRTSTAAASDAVGVTALGNALAGDLGVTSFDGQDVVGNDVLVKYTYYGDADLNGGVNGDDESQILAGLFTAGAGGHWLT